MSTYVDYVVVLSNGLLWDKEDENLSFGILRDFYRMGQHRHATMKPVAMYADDKFYRFTSDKPELMCNDEDDKYRALTEAVSAHVNETNAKNLCGDSVWAEQIQDHNVVVFEAASTVVDLAKMQRQTECWAYRDLFYQATIKVDGVGTVMYCEYCCGDY